MKERHSIICAAYLLLFDKNKVLLLRRFNTGYEDGNYSVPAGHVEKEESVRGALVREVKEEVGIDINPDSVKLAHVVHRNSSHSNDERLDFFFSCHAWSGEVEICEPDKCDVLLWVDANDLPDNVIPYIKQAIEGAIKNIQYSEMHW